MKKILTMVGLMTMSLFILDASSYPENGTSASTLFLWHCDTTLGQATADFAKAVSGPLPAISGNVALATNTAKFGSGSYPMDDSNGDTFSLYTNGQWVWYPHECTIDYWLYSPSDWAGSYRSVGPGFSQNGNNEFRIAHTGGSLCNHIL